MIIEITVKGIILHTIGVHIVLIRLNLVWYALVFEQLAIEFNFLNLWLMSNETDITHILLLP
jgi:hypothetical protein